MLLIFLSCQNLKGCLLVVLIQCASICPTKSDGSMTVLPQKQLTHTTLFSFDVSALFCIGTREKSSSISVCGRISSSSPSSLVSSSQIDLSNVARRSCPGGSRSSRIDSVLLPYRNSPSSWESEKTYKSLPAAVPRSDGLGKRKKSLPSPK